MPMRLGKEFAIDIPELHFRFTPYHKFSVILGESGRGKSYIADLIGNNAFFTEMRRFAAVWDLALITVKNDFLIVFDEVDFNRFVHTQGISILNNSPNAFLIITRTIPIEIPLDYRAMYTLQSTKKYWYTTTRLFNDYVTFDYCKKVYVEDSGSGYQYYRNHLTSCKVESLQGRNNVYNIKEKSLVIADGAVFGQILYQVLQTKPYLKFYLPDSFEGLVLEHTPRAVTVVSEAHKDPVLNYLSIERYYTDKIAEFYENYTKSRLSDIINKKKLLPEIKYDYFERNGIISEEDKERELARLRDLFGDFSNDTLIEKAIQEFC